MFHRDLSLSHSLSISLSISISYSISLNFSLLENFPTNFLFWHFLVIFKLNKKKFLEDFGREPSQFLDFSALEGLISSEPVSFIKKRVQSCRHDIHLERSSSMLKLLRRARIHERLWGMRVRGYLWLFVQPLLRLYQHQHHCNHESE